ncbi:MAG: SLC13/DASS family transporter [Firmicutes bacterium]|nr:SLC13/DASS family transporter [Bacillota bacterium]
MASSTIALIIMAVVIILYATEIIPLAVTSVAACLAMAIFKVIPFKDAFAGFGSDTVMLVIGMVVIGNALFETGVAKLIGTTIVRLVGTNEKIFLVTVILVAAAISAFMSNTATVAMFMPVIATVAVSSGGLITKKNTYMALGIAAVAGGMCTLVGSTPQLIAQGILTKTGCRPMGFFELAYGGVPVVLACAVYFFTIGYALQKKVFDFPEKQEVAIAASAATEEAPPNPVKMWISSLTLVGCIIAFVAQIWTVGTIALVGALICVITGCIAEKKAYQTMDWVAVAVLGGALGFADGLDKSGAGKLIADTAIRLLGQDASPWMVFALIVGVATVLTNIMSNTAVTAMLTPIGIFMAKGLGLDPVTVVIGIILGANLSYATPIATTPVTLTLIGGYRFMDYVKVGGLFNILAYLVVIVVVPLFLPLR